MVSHLLHVGVARSVEILPSPTLFRVNFGHQFLRQLEDGTLATDAQHAIVMIDEATGAFSCQSGFMDFAYTWHPSRRESDIFTFLASLDFDYFMAQACKCPLHIFALTPTIPPPPATNRTERRGQPKFN